MRLWDFHFSYEYIMKMSNFNVVKWNVPCRSRDEGGKQTRWERWGFWRQRCAVVSTVCWAAVETSDDQLPHLLMPANHYTCKYNSFITSSSDRIDAEVRCINPVPVCPRRRALIHSARMPKGAVGDLLNPWVAWATGSRAPTGRTEASLLYNTYRTINPSIEVEPLASISTIKSDHGLYSRPGFY